MLNYLREIMGDEFKDFLEVINEPKPKTIRINTLKIDREKFLEIVKGEGWVLNQLNFYGDGFEVLEPKYELGNTLYHFLGYFYIQSASSMIPPLLLNPTPNSTVLDMCAAPGSKTTQIAQLMNNKGVIIANEVDKNRIHILRENLQRMGVLNTILIREDGRKLNIGEKFDRILVDAPCSGLGTLPLEEIKKFSLNFSKNISKIQKKLLERAFLNLKKGGRLVYSTCTYTIEENEEVIQYLMEKYSFKLEKPKIKGIKFREGFLKNTIRIYPQDFNSEGFFIGVIKK